MPGLVIVDDEAIVRRTVAQIIAESGLDLGPVAQASSGEEAVSLAREMRPDIVLMDVKMPGLDGIEAIRLIRAQHLGARVVMLTAYDEFSFAQEAIKLGVVDYLLKPIRPATLIGVLSRLQTKIREEERALLTTEEARGCLRDTLPLAESELVEALVNGSIDESETIDRILGHLGRTIRWPAVIVAGIDRCYSAMQNTGPEEDNCFSGWLPDIVRGVVPDLDRCLIGQIGQRVVVTIVSADQELADVSKIRSLGEAIRYAVKMRGVQYCVQHCIRSGDTVTVTAGIGRRYPDLESVPLSYAEAMRAQWHKLYLGRDTVIHIDDADVIDANSLTYPFELERELLSHVRQGNRQSSEEIMNRLIEHLLDRPGSSPEVVHRRLMELIVLVSRATIDAGAPASEILEMSHHLASPIPLLDTGRDVRAWAVNSLSAFMSKIRVVDHTALVIEGAIEYVINNQQRADLKLKDVARAVHMSPSRLAHLFKDRMGMSFVKYLTTLRVEEAKRLLRTTEMTVAAVARAAGYEDPTYFHRVFRRETGTTPAAYRRMVRSDYQTGNPLPKP